MHLLCEFADPIQAAQLTALGLGLQDPNESGIVATLQPGAYTAIMAGKNQTSGIGLVEIYDTDPSAASQLANISTRGFVQTGDNVMIGGFILGTGSASADVAVRGLGPSLSRFMLIDVLDDPTLELHDGNGALLIANDNWQDDPVSAAQLTAHGLAPPDPLESGIFATLPPGLFTAILAGKNGGTGIGLIEVYDISVTGLPTPTPGGTPSPTPTATATSTPTPTPTAAPSIVTSTADNGAGSLRDAIAAASDGDTIQFDAALNGQTIGLTSGELVIDKNITINGPGPSELAVSGSFAFRIFHVMPGHTVIIEGLTISGGSADGPGHGVLNDQSTLTIDNCSVRNNRGEFSPNGGDGGGIYNNNAMLTITNSTIADNFAIIFGGFGSGGGVYNVGTLEIANSTISGNLAYQNGGGIFSAGSLQIINSTIGGNNAGFKEGSGGGIVNDGTATISNSTVSDNRAPGIYKGKGGFDGGISNGGTLTISNSTVSGNTASGSGGGIGNGGMLTIINSTLSGNSANQDGGGISNSATLEIGNTILNAGTSGANIFGSSGTVTSLGYNLSSDKGGGFLTATGDQINTDPMLGPLQDNGGPTFTHELLTGSPAIDAGDPTFTPPPLYDQRGFGYDRVVNGRVDIGSFEVQP